MRKAALHNLGCKVNAYETEAMTQLLSESGYEIVPFSEKADVYIVNTCSVTNIADRKSRQMLHRARKLNPDAVVVATGCYAQTATEKIAEDASIDLIVGNNKKKDIVNLLADFFEEKAEKTNIIDINHTDEYEELEISTVTEHTRAHLKIQDGCNSFCTYCIIPYARGRIRSRKVVHIIEEVERLAKKGFQEVVLTGINLSCYEDEGKKLIDVIEAINEIDGIARIRLGSLDPEVITEEFTKRLAKVEKICPHFHLSMQSGCDKTLMAMNRHYTSQEFYEICERLRRYFKQPALTTDVIVGFPQETEEDFETTKRFVEKVGFAELHVFKYSRRDGTVAAKMQGQVDEQVKNRRSEILIETGKKLTKEFHERIKGTAVEVLFEENVEIQGKRYAVGHTKDYVKIAVETLETLDGKIRQVTVTDGLNDEIMLATL
ncbi:MAG: tRNA (N(6)-L-threonylcarbamoyladenosine(37)-C(2))-methylthiotransferase MtaB [Eubacterium sp.]|nr:tRNA (N(6)-L-threonylcarbamoyladenosine(37)-C(2))-methylthiotransferase MtaB [Eubacterium sp.]